MLQPRLGEQPREEQPAAAHAPQQRPAAPPRCRLQRHRVRAGAGAGAGVGVGVGVRVRIGVTVVVRQGSGRLGLVPLGLAKVELA